MIKINFILITSKQPRSGKDTCAEILKKIFDDHGTSIIYYHTFFAKPLVGIFEKIFNVEWNEYKKILGNREKLIDFSNTCKKIDQYVFIKNTIDELKMFITKFCTTFHEDQTNSGKNIIFNIIISDLRYNYEYDAIKSLSKYLGTYEKNIECNINVIEIKTTYSFETISDRDTYGEFFNKYVNFKIFNDMSSIQNFEKEIRSISKAFV